MPCMAIDLQEKLPTFSDLLNQFTMKHKILNGVRQVRWALARKVCHKLNKQVDGVWDSRSGYTLMLLFHVKMGY